MKFLVPPANVLVMCHVGKLLLRFLDFEVTPSFIKGVVAFRCPTSSMIVSKNTSLNGTNMLTINLFAMVNEELYVQLRGSLASL